jgi:hypothetical protein
MVEPRSDKHSPPTSLALINLTCSGVQTQVCTPKYTKFTKGGERLRAVCRQQKILADQSRLKVDNVLRHNSSQFPSLKKRG